MLPNRLEGWDTVLALALYLVRVVIDTLYILIELDRCVGCATRTWLSDGIILSMATSLLQKLLLIVSLSD